MAMKIQDVRPRRQYFWVFALSILVLTGVVLTKYDVRGKFQSFIVARPVAVSVPQSGKLISSRNLLKRNETRNVLEIVDRVKEGTDSFLIDFDKDMSNKNKNAYIKTNRTTNNTVQESGIWKTTSTVKTDIRDGQEVRNIVYAKVHKAASSVIQNMLLRFAMSRKLNVLLPIEGHILNEHGSQIDDHKILPLPKGENYNILCNHVIFNKREIQRFFPKTTAYIGIIRHPLQQLSSALNYYAKRYHKSNYPLVFKMFPGNPLAGFLSRPYAFDLDDPRQSYVNNRMSIDLGFPVSTRFERDKMNIGKIKEFIKRLDANFDLMLIVELFDESLVLLRRLLNWRTEDILYKKLNVRSDTYDFHLTRREEYLHMRWAPIDYALYEHFKKRLQIEISNEGEDFYMELKKYRQVRDDVVQFCGFNNKPEDSKLSVEPTKWSKGFVVTDALCNLMSEGETSMVAMVKQRQRDRLGLTEPKYIHF